MSASTTVTAHGLNLLEACNYDRRLCGAMIALQKENVQKELLDSIPAGPSRRNVAVAVWQIREALGQDAAYAREITQGE
jgi:hypothetical protein